MKKLFNTMKKCKDTEVKNTIFMISTFYLYAGKVSKAKGVSVDICLQIMTFHICNNLVFVISSKKIVEDNECIVEQAKYEVREYCRKTSELIKHLVLTLTVGLYS